MEIYLNHKLNDLCIRIFMTGYDKNWNLSTFLLKKM